VEGGQRRLGFGLHRHGMDALALGDEALAMARRVGDAAALAYVVNARRCTSWEAASGVRRRAATDEMLALADAAGDRDLELLARRWRVIERLESGDLAAMDDAITAYEALADQRHHGQASYWPAVWRTTRALLDGRFDAAEDLIPTARHLGDRLDPCQASLTAQGQTIVLLREQVGHASLVPRRAEEPPNRRESIPAVPILPI